MMEDIGKHPDHGKREPPELAPTTISVEMLFTVQVDVYGNPLWGEEAVEENLRQIAQRGIDEGMVTSLGPGIWDMELVDYEITTEVP